jgi:hypothetical protein
MLYCISNKLKRTAWVLRYASLKDHAKYELERAGLFSKDSDYEGATGNAVLELCDCFSKQGHSGASAELALEIFDKLARFKTLTPITDDPQEWNNVSHMGSSDTPPMWQNKRDSSYFSHDGGKTWWSV